MPREGSNAFYRAYADRWYLDRANKDNYLYRSSASKIGLSGGLVVPDLETLDGIDISAHAADLAAHTRNTLQVLRTGSYMPLSSFAGVAATRVLYTNKLIAIPFIAVRDMTVDRIAVHVTTGVAGTIRLGIYNNGTNLYPGTLLLDAGTIDCTTTGVKAITISQALTKGIYWLALVSGVAPTLRTWDYWQTILGIHPDGFDSALCGWGVTFTYAALPTPFTADGYVGGDFNYIIALRLLTLD